MRRIVVLGLLASLTGCGQSDYAKFKANYDLGFQDGYAVGFVNTCKDGKFAVSAVIDAAGYDDGYKAGRKQGAFDCTVEKEG